MTSSITIRQGHKKDIPAVFQLIKELALYEKAPEEVVVTAEQLEDWAFGEKPHYAFIVAEENDEIIGISLYYTRFSTWKGPLLYLEDLIVTEKARGKGLGKMLFVETMRIAQKENKNGMNWQVLDWNEPAIKFYDTFGASYSAEWLNGKLSRKQIDEFLNQ